MNYLYHKVPEGMQGSILYPLNMLKDTHPDIYQIEVKKYEGREHIKEQRIPLLNCLWNDVLHFSAVNPIHIKQALIDAGRGADFIMNYYQVDPELIKQKDAVVYLYAHDGINDKLSEKNFVPYDSHEVGKFSVMPQATKDYYKETISHGGRPLLYHRVPHILYRGTIDVTDLPIISV